VVLFWRSTSLGESGAPKTHDLPSPALNPRCRLISSSRHAMLGTLPFPPPRRWIQTYKHQAQLTGRYWGQCLFAVVAQSSAQGACLALGISKMSIPSLLTPTDIFLNSYHGNKRNADYMATHTTRSLFNKLCITPWSMCSSICGGSRYYHSTHSWHSLHIMHRLPPH
jgi:hypothetical protein